MKLQKHYLSAFLCLHLFFAKIIFGADPGSIIIHNVKTHLKDPPIPYEAGQPPNKELLYGGVIDLDAWNGKYDCSGLVSYAGTLRRHYTISQLHNFVDATSWSGLRGGDLIMNSKHVLIFEGRYTDEWGTKRLITIESSSSKGLIRRGPDENIHGYRDPAEYPDADLKQYMGCLPYSFKTDSTPPEINICGVENGTIYNHPVTVSFIIVDSIKANQYDPYAFAEMEAWGKILTNSNANNPGMPNQKEKTFSQEGIYTISFYAEDWAKNPAHKTIQFTITNKWQADLKISSTETDYTITVPLYTTQSKPTHSKHRQHILETTITSDELKPQGRNFEGKVKIKATETLIHYSEGCPGEDCDRSNYEKIYPQITASSTWEIINNNEPHCRITFHQPISTTEPRLPLPNPISANLTISPDDKSILINEISDEDECQKKIIGKISPFEPIN